MDVTQQTIFEKMDATLAQKVNNRLGCSLWITLIFVFLVGFSAFQVGRASSATGTSIGVGGFFLGTVKADALPQTKSAPAESIAPANPATPPAQLPVQSPAPEPSAPVASLSVEAPLTADHFNRLQMGMSFEDALGILGGPTKVLRSYTSNTTEGKNEFTWYRWGDSRPQITLLFKNGSLFVKEQKGIF